MLYDGAPATLVSLIGHKQYRRCARDLYYFLQSTICLKQLIWCPRTCISVFPELTDLVKDITRRHKLSLILRCREILYGMARVGANALLLLLIITRKSFTGQHWEMQGMEGGKWQMFFTQGWCKFVGDNHLVVGDACVYELIKEFQAAELMPQVHILRSRVEENSTNLHTGSVSMNPALSTGKNCILQFDESKHTENSVVFGPVSSDRTNLKTS
ncbi:hypothetical protein HAX54_019118 [Datura stramonium]|uniref:TF-B3 domain-containing protein n=1 Tax=Datura stramonium TaxID=4076 RepID=A0ABS8UQN4_DATST|nr:hypothetical protein [Datura stramonium]